MEIIKNSLQRLLMSELYFHFEKKTSCDSKKCVDVFFNVAKTHFKITVVVLSVFVESRQNEVTVLSYK